MDRVCWDNGGRYAGKVGGEMQRYTSNREKYVVNFSIVLKVNDIRKHWIQTG